MHSITTVRLSIGDVLSALGKLLQKPQPQPVLVPVRVPVRPINRRRRVS
jgi:hypothetical protein